MLPAVACTAASSSTSARTDFDRGDFLIRGVLGADRTGAVAVGDRAGVGDVQFQVRDAEAPTRTCRSVARAGGAAGALLFTCNGRGALFGAPTTTRPW